MSLYKCAVCSKDVTQLADDLTPLYFIVKNIQGPHFNFLIDLPLCGCECGTKWSRENDEDLK